MPMKNAARNLESLRAVCKSLLKEGKPPAAPKLEPLKALVRAAMSYDVSDSRADDAMRAIEREFVELNEMRVATELEVQEMLGSRYPEIEQRVEMITRCLNAIFEREHTLSLDRLRTISKRDARQFIRELPLIHPFVEAYVMMYAFETPAMPMDGEILEYLRGEGMFDEKTSVEDAQRFLEHNLKAEEMHDFFVLIRRAAHSEAAKARRKAKV
jgi:endonuclease III